MKNLFTYKNNIASGLKRYGKFLLLAISLLFLSNTAWAAPSEMWVWYCGHTSNQWNEANLKLVPMQSLGNNRWSFDIDLTVNDYQFFFATSNSKSSILEKDKLHLKDFSPSCATSSTQIEGYNVQGKNNAGRLHVGHSNGDCQITLVVTYISNSEYIIQVDSPCKETEPSITTGTTYSAGSNNWLIVEGTVLNELYKNEHCERFLDGIQICILDKSTKNQLAQYDFNLNGKTYLDYRGEEIRIPTEYSISENICYKAKAWYAGNHVAYGEIVCIAPDPDPDPSGTTPSIRIGKQPVVSNLTDVAMNFQIADWGCTTVNTIKVYYTRTDAGIPNNTEPTTSSDVWEFTTDINGNINTTLNKEDLPSGNYNIKAVACNASGCGELSDMASFTIQACEKPAQPSVQNTNRTNCSDLLIAFNIAVGNKALITINEGTGTTTVAPQDGQAYTAAVAPAGITIQDINYEGAIVKATITGLDGHKQYTVTCYQYVEATHCYSEPITSVIEKIAPEIEVAVTDITLSTAIANIKVKNTLGVLDNLTVKWYLNGVAQSNSRNLKDAPDSDGNISYTITNLFEDKTYQLDVYALNNYGCETTTERVEFTTKTCPALTPQTVTGVNTIGKVQATITMASSQTDAIYQLFIGDTPIDGSVQEGTGEALTWQVNQTGLYYVKGWFKEVPDGCANGATIMGRYDLDCVQAPTPVISIDKNTICSNDNATISVTAVEGVIYQLYKDGDLVSDKKITNDGKFTSITEAGSYTVVATTKDICQASATSQIVTLTVIDASASVTINPTTDTTTPWVPVNFTVTSTAGAPYTLVYKDAAGNDVTNQMVVVKKGNSYSLKIPRPEDWKPGDSKDPVDTTTYTVEASLEGQASCGSTSTLTITLNDTFEICK